MELDHNKEVQVNLARINTYLADSGGRVMPVGGKRV